MLPGLGFQHIMLVALLALIVVGPKDLPLMLRKLGQWTARLRAMANEFRQGFDELARQAELDELRKEVDALRRMSPLGDLHQHALDIERDFHSPLDPAASASTIAEAGVAMDAGGDDAHAAAGLATGAAAESASVSAPERWPESPSVDASASAPESAAASAPEISRHGGLSVGEGVDVSESAPADTRGAVEAPR